MSKNNISLNIRHLRKKNNLTQLQLGDILGVTDSQVTNYEKGKSSPPIDSVLKLCEHFKVELQDFVYEVMDSEQYLSKAEFKSETTEGCMMAGGCILRRVAVLESDLQKLKEP